MKTTDSKFEYNVLRIACFFGLVRSVIEVSRDLLSSVIEPNFFLDIAFIFVLILFKMNTSLIENT